MNDIETLARRRLALVEQKDSLTEAIAAIDAQLVDAIEVGGKRAEKAEADALVLIANNKTLQREAKDAWRRVDQYARIVQRVVGVCEDKYVGPPTEYGQGFQEGYNDAMGVVQAALNTGK